MTDYFKFPDESTFIGLAEAEGLVDAEGALVISSATHAIDVVGTITQGGTYDENGEVITTPEVLPGYHVNTQGISSESWESYRVIVNTPVRIFFLTLHRSCLTKQSP